MNRKWLDGEGEEDIAVDEPTNVWIRENYVVKCCAHDIETHAYLGCIACVINLMLERVADQTVIQISSPEMKDIFDNYNRTIVDMDKKNYLLEQQLDKLENPFELEIEQLENANEKEERLEAELKLIRAKMFKLRAEEKEAVLLLGRIEKSKNE